LHRGDRRNLEAKLEAKRCLQAVKASNDGEAVDTEALAQYCIAAAEKVTPRSINDNH
jgi:hypothetical protein